MRYEELKKMPHLIEVEVRPERQGDYTIALPDGRTIFVPNRSALDEFGLTFKRGDLRELEVGWTVNALMYDQYEELAS